MRGFPFFALIWVMFQPSNARAEDTIGLDARQAIKLIAHCLVETRPKEARELPSLLIASESSDQLVIALQPHSCLPPNGRKFSFPGSILRGAIIEELYRSELGDDAHRLKATKIFAMPLSADISGMSLRSARELSLFQAIDCVAQMKPDVVTIMLNAEIGGAEEESAAEVIRETMPSCAQIASPPSTPAVRSAVAESAYRRRHQPEAGGGE